MDPVRAVIQCHRSGDLQEPSKAGGRKKAYPAARALFLTADAGGSRTPVTSVEVWVVEIEDDSNLRASVTATSVSRQWCCFRVRDARVEQADAAAVSLRVRFWIELREQGFRGKVGATPAWNFASAPERKLRVVVILPSVS